MAKYKVYQRWYVWTTQVVEAEDEESALDATCEMPPPSLCHQCVREIDGDITPDQSDDAVDVILLTE